MKIKIGKLRRIIKEERTRFVQPVNENVLTRAGLRQMIKEEFSRSLNEIDVWGQAIDASEEGIEACPDCSGAGWVDDENGGYECQTCGASGEILSDYDDSSHESLAQYNQANALISQLDANTVRALNREAGEYGHRGVRGFIDGFERFEMIGPGKITGWVEQPGPSGVANYAEIDLQAGTLTIDFDQREEW